MTNEGMEMVATLVVLTVWGFPLPVKFPSVKKAAEHAQKEEYENGWIETDAYIYDLNGIRLRRNHD